MLANTIECTATNEIALAIPSCYGVQMSEEDEHDLGRTREEQAYGPLPIDSLLIMLDADFPELVERARGVLAAERIPRRQAEILVRNMIEREATWLRARHPRFKPSWFRSRMSSCVAATRQK